MTDSRQLLSVSALTRFFI